MRFKPAVSPSWLIATAGLLWSAVGIALCRLAWMWLAPLAPVRAALPGAAGIAGALVVYRFGFSKIARRNLDRLGQLSQKVCFFAFQAWRSYVLIAFMITLGLFLRHWPVPKPYLAVLYTTIGGALFLASFHYYHHLYHQLARRRSGRPDADESD